MKIPLHLKQGDVSVEALQKRAGLWLSMKGLVKPGHGGFRERTTFETDTPFEQLLILSGRMWPRNPGRSMRGWRKYEARQEFIRKCKEEGNPSKAWNRPPGNLSGAKR